MVTEPGPLTVEVDGVIRTLGPDDELTFGRDPSCTVRFGADDLGVSRHAGRIRVAGGAWCVTNLSSKRPLHVSDAHGFAVPLPVAKHGWPASRRAVDQPQLTILVPGDTWTYALTVRPAGIATTAAPPPPESPLSTQVPVLRMTDNRREVLVALARGYLRPYPHYDPQPAGYDDVAALVGLTRTQVTRRIEDIREALIAAGVEGLDGNRDTRRSLCEWLLAMRMIRPADLDWLTSRIAEPPPRPMPRPRSPQPPPPPSPLPPPGPAPDVAEEQDVVPSDTSAFGRTPRVRVQYACHRAARAVVPPLQARLASVHGANWLDAVNAPRRKRGMEAIRSLDDDRGCLGLLAHDKATRGWVPPDVRTAAISLKKLANTATHGDQLPADATAVADGHADRICHWAASTG